MTTINSVYVRTQNIFVSVTIPFETSKATAVNEVITELITNYGIDETKVSFQQLIVEDYYSQAGSNYTIVYNHYI